MKLSYVHGNTGPPLIGSTIGRYLDDVAARFPEAEALISCAQAIRWSYADLKREADSLAAGLAGLGLARGDRIGIWSPNRAEWTVIQYAAARIGLILVTINPAYRVTELEHVLNTSGCVALVVAGQFKSSDYVTMVETPLLRSEFHPGNFGLRPSRNASACR